MRKTGTPVFMSLYKLREYDTIESQHIAELSTISIVSSCKQAMGVGTK